MDELIPVEVTEVAMNEDGEEVSEDQEEGELTHWSIRFQQPDGNRIRYVFPKEQLTWRAAEYGIPLEDTKQLMDLVLHEPFMGEIHRPLEELGAKKEESEKFMTVSNGTHPKKVRAGRKAPTYLFNAESVDDAREAHLLRIELTKKNRVKVVTDVKDATKKSIARAAETVTPVDVVGFIHSRRNLESEDYEQKAVEMGMTRVAMGRPADIPEAVLRKRVEKTTGTISVEVDVSASRREVERREDPEDEMFGKPLP